MAVTDGHTDLTSVADATDVATRLDAVERRLDDVETRLGEMEAATQALRGYLGGVDGVSDAVERRADLALAKAEAVEDAVFDGRDGLAVERLPDADAPAPGADTAADPVDGADPAADTVNSVDADRDGNPRPRTGGPNVNPSSRAAAEGARRRAQVEPLAALAALFAVCVGLSVYALVLADAGRPTDRGLAEPALAAVDDAVSVSGVAHPARLDRAVDARPSGTRLNVTLTTDSRAWAVGPTPAVHGDRATRRVSVRLGPGRVRVGRLRVVVWR
ncbi:DUF7285 family protein [Salinigranum marinum]|uniref:DUF7285 family protein n=1 Tax=Salinigranum marinum TaxID=1515595 RepID=UPI00298A04ED|nr:hypothetical protein [Salinigranum marinum]